MVEGVLAKLGVETPHQLPFILGDTKNYTHPKDTAWTAEEIPHCSSPPDLNPFAEWLPDTDSEVNKRT